MGIRDSSDFKQALDACAGMEDVRIVCREFARALRFNHFLVCLRARGDDGRLRRWLVSGDGDGGIGDRAAQFVDSVLTVCMDHVAPFVVDAWRLPGRFRGDAHAQDALCLPVHRPYRGSMALLLAPWAHRAANGADTAQLRGESGLFAAHLDGAMRRVISREPGQDGGSGLTRRERECLLLAAEGKTLRETADIHGISQRTVVYHLRNAMDKLNAGNRCKAVARAVASGLVCPEFDRSDGV